MPAAPASTSSKPALWKWGAILGALALAAGAVLFLREPEQAPPPSPEELGIEPGWKMTRQTDPEEVFKRAFWRRSTPEDKIQHAERTEWSDAKDGVRKWQWFLAVEPSPALTAYLETNPFSLPEAPDYLASRDTPGSLRPAWFPAEASEGWQIRRNGRLAILRHAKKKLVFAADAGTGFAPPVK